MHTLPKIWYSLAVSHCYMCDACTIFSWKCPIFFGDWWFFMWLLVIFWLGLGTPRHIATSKSPFYMVVVLVWKSWDLVRHPPTSLGENPNFYWNFFWRLPLSSIPTMKRSHCQMHNRPRLLNVKPEFWVIFGPFWQIILFVPNQTSDNLDPITYPTLYTFNSIWKIK